MADMCIPAWLILFVAVLRCERAAGEELLVGWAALRFSTGRLFSLQEKGVGISL
jgi:hypothetical protein